MSIGVVQPPKRLILLIRMDYSIRKIVMNFLLEGLQILLM